MNKYNNNDGLDSPLVVHKKSDSSYQPTQAEIEASKEIAQEDNSTLERHRFKKEKKKHSSFTIWIILFIVAGVIAALYFGGVIGDRNNKNGEDTSSQSATEQVTTIEQKYADTIVVKGTYIFVNGHEVNGVEGMLEEIKYEDVSPTRFTIIDEGAESNFLSKEVLGVLEDLGFYDETTKVTPVISTGLMAEEEQTTKPETTENITENITENENSESNDDISE